MSRLCLYINIKFFKKGKGNFLNLQFIINLLSVIYKKDDDPDYFYIIRKGKV